jgi:hypothetical protein
LYELKWLSISRVRDFERRLTNLEKVEFVRLWVLRCMRPLTGLNILRVRAFQRRLAATINLIVRGGEKGGRGLN